MRLAGEIAKRDDGRVRVVIAVEPFPQAALSALALVSPPTIDESQRVAAHAIVERQLAAAIPARMRKAWTIRATIGWPTESIINESTRFRASMIVVGIGRHKPVDRYLGHETALAVVRWATVPVLAVSPKAASLPRHLLVATDFTDSSVRAARLAATLLAPGGVITLVHVSPLAQFTRRDGVSWTDVYATGAAARLEAIRGELRGATGRRVAAALLEGEIVETLLERARGAHCDLIAVGGHLQGLVDRMLVGSVTTRILRGAACSVFVAPQREARPRSRPRRA
jgi:nucleotide-binding universal stress UspA family protein